MISSPSTQPDLFPKILSARNRLHGVAHVTPVLTSQALDRLCGAKVLLKCENFQRAGAFKFRGAYNAMSRLTASQKARGVLTFSSGNHGQAVALVGRLLGITTTVVMPANASAAKRAAAEEYGASVVEYDPQSNREEIANDLLHKYGGTLVPPFDDHLIIAGQGTATLEFFEQTGGFDLLLVPVGGGGLLSGSVLAAKGCNPRCRVIGIEPELADDAARSFRSGVLQTVHNPPTIAEGTRTSSLGRKTFPLILKHADDIVTVSESAIMEAVQFLFYRMKLVVEPSGALAVAALLSGVISEKGRIGVLLSGGNIDGASFSTILKFGFAQH